MGSLASLFDAAGEEFLLNVLSIVGGVDNLFANFIGSVAK